MRMCAWSAGVVLAWLVSFSIQVKARIHRIPRKKLHCCEMKLFTLTFSGINFVADQCKVITTCSCDITEQIVLFVDLKKKISM